MSQLDVLAAQSMAHEREHTLQTALRRRHPERHVQTVPVAAAPRRHRFHDALVHLHLAHATLH